MTTNSPNPVDGDVQAMIEHCKSVSKYALDKEMRDQYGPLDRKMAEIALAALTAKPYAYASRNTDMSKESEYFSASVFNNSWGEEYTMPLYTTPPAQLLRPVELPGGFSPAIGDIFDRQAPVMRRDREEGCWIHKAVVAELLRSLGHEVKE